MHNKGLFRGRFKVAGPVQQSGLICVGGKAVQGVDTGINRNFLSENAHGFGPVHQTSAQSALCLKSGNQHAAPGAGQIVAQVVTLVSYLTGRSSVKACFASSIV